MGIGSKSHHVTNYIMLIFRLCIPIPITWAMTIGHDHDIGTRAHDAAADPAHCSPLSTGPGLMRPVAWASPNRAPIGHHQGNK